MRPKLFSLCWINSHSLFTAGIQGVRAGSFNSFGVGSGYCSGGEVLGGSHYSVPGLTYGRQVSRMLLILGVTVEYCNTMPLPQAPGCGCCQGRAQCSNPNSHYESASIYREGIYLQNLPTTEQNKIYFNSDGGGFCHGLLLIVVFRHLCKNQL